MRILATLPSERWDIGTWALLGDDDQIISGYGTFPADGKSDNSSASAHSNPLRDPTKPFGDTPIGEYTGTLSYVPDEPQNRRSYGLPDETKSIPVIRLQPQVGDTQAWQRQTNEGITVNMELMIHAGPPNGNNQLRPTHGCLRTWQNDFTKVYLYLEQQFVKEIQVSIEERILT